MSSTTLAVTYHDPPGRMFAQMRAVLPVVQDIFGAVVVEATAASRGPATDLLVASGADVVVGRWGRWSTLARQGAPHRHAAGA